MSDRKSKPTHAIVATTYEELWQFVDAFAKEKLNLLILVGPAGTAKSQSVQAAIGDKACWIEGNATAFGIFTKLWKHRDKLVVIDDVDSLYADRAAVRLLKCLCQTNPVKTVQWNTAAVGKDAEGVPKEFQTSSRVCIIANDWKTLDANTAAVQDRGHLVFFEPTAVEVHRQVAEWFDDEAIFDWFGEHLHLIPNPSMRNYVRAAELKNAGIDWVQVLLSDAVPKKALLISKLRADSRFKEERDRVKAFSEAGGGGKTTYYKWKARLQNPDDSATLVRLKITKEPQLERAA